MDLTLYQKMIGSSATVTESYINDTIVHVNDMFSKSPSIRTVQFDGANTDVIINRKKSNVLDILLRPKSIVNKGVYAKINTVTFLVTEFVPNELYPKATIELCNATLKWKGTDNSIKEFKCIVKGNTYSEVEPSEKERFVVTSNNEIVILVQYNDDTKSIKPNQRFIFGENAYEVSSIDAISNVFEDQGIMKLGVKFASVTDTDDKENQIADASGNSGWGGW